jgi:hypothetical protein
MRRLTGDPPADAYLASLAGRARHVLGRAFVGAYLVNSGARADYLPGRSDLDVALIVAGQLDVPTRCRVADALRHGSLPCPAPRLELVVYQCEVAADPGSRPPFELNLNTGSAIDDHVAFDPAAEPWFWFLLDLAAAAEAAAVIDGPPAERIFGAVPRHAVLEALRDAHAWHAVHDAVAPNRVLNACRAWCWMVTSKWPSKTAAAAWGIDAGGDAELISHALALRAAEREDPLPAERVERFTMRVARVIEDGAEVEPRTA